MTHDDAGAAVDLLDVVWGVPPTDRSYGLRRLGHLITTDPEGAWVHTGADGTVDGVALAILREGIWGLSLLIVHPDHQSGGIGSELMAAATAYGADARGGIILASSDARALRAYWRAGFKLLPAFDVRGAVRTPPAPSASVREGRWPADRELTDAVGRAVRGAAHGTDLEPYLASGLRLRVHDDGGFAVHGPEGRIRLVAATAEPVARALLETVLHDLPTAEIAFLDARQDWAIDVALQAGLRLIPEGAVCVRGDLGPMHPYLPSGAYL